MIHHAQPAESRDVDVVLRFPTSNPDLVVGTQLRPSRPLTRGRRPSDRWLAWSLGAALILLGLSSLWTSARNAGAADTVNRIDERVAQIATACQPTPR